MTMKASTGNFFEDFSIGQTLRHPTPRTVLEGDIALYIALYGDRRALHSSAEFARTLGYKQQSAQDLLVFHIVFGKSVGDISLNAVANLGYANVRFLRPVFAGDTLSAESEVIGLREASSGKNGIVYVRTRGINQRGEEVLRFVRWVLVNKRDSTQRTGIKEVPVLPEAVMASDVSVPAGLCADNFSKVQWATGGAARWDDYRVGERIDHIDGMTLDPADHTLATRLYQNTAKVHFNQHEMESSRFGTRLVYGGHIISVAHALAINGLENAIAMVAWNSGAHANPSFAGDTIYAWTEALDKQPVAGRTDLGALRLRMIATKNVDPRAETVAIKGEDGKYTPSVVLDLDYWALVVR